LKLLRKYQLIAVEKERQAGNGVQIVIKPRFQAHPLEITVTI